MSGIDDPKQRSKEGYSNVLGAPIPPEVEREIEERVEESRRRVRSVLIGMGVAAVGYLLYLLANANGVFPPHPKTLLRDSAILGFAGAVLVIEALAREVFNEARQIADALLLVGAILIVFVSAGLATGILVAIFGLLFVWGGWSPVETFIDRYGLTPTVNKVGRCSATKPSARGDQSLSDWHF
jgi:MFS family permease